MVINPLIIQILDYIGLLVYYGKIYLYYFIYIYLWHKDLCSNDYDSMIKEIHDYTTGIRLPCNHCNKKFKHINSLNNHHKYFHKITG